MDTVVSSLLHFAKCQPDAVAFIEKGQRLTYEGLARRARATAAWLARAGVRAGDTVALALDPPMARSSVSSLQFLYGLAHVGAVVLPLYPVVPTSRRLDLMTRFQARWLIERGKPRSATSWTPIDPAACDWRACERDAETTPRGDDPKRPFLFHFSGGTTGVPKVVLFSHEQFVNNMVVGAVQIGATGADRLVSARPWPTLPGLRYLLRIHTMGGVFVNAPFPETRQELERLIAESGVTILVASPWQLRRLLASAPPRAGRGPELRALYIIGGAVTPEEIERARELITRNLFPSYATSEAGVITLLRPDEPVGSMGYVGRLIPGMEAHVVDADDNPVPAGTMGSLGFRAPWIPYGYVNNETASARSFRDGWYYPGDLGTIGEDGSVSVFGRVDDVINFGGIKIVPQDVELVLLQHPDIEDAAMVGMPHPMAGKMPVALLVLRRPATTESLTTFLRPRIDGAHMPAAFVEVPEIFRSADGKILRQRLLDEYQALASAPR